VLHQRAWAQLCVPGADGRVIYTTPTGGLIRSAFCMHTFVTASGEPRVITGGNAGVMGMYNADTGALIRAIRYDPKTTTGNPAEGIMTYRDEVGLPCGLLRLTRAHGYRPIAADGLVLHAKPGHP
jgi:hypothetical protein